MSEAKLTILEASALDLDDPIGERVPQRVRRHIARFASATNPLEFDVHGGRQLFEEVLQDPVVKRSLERDGDSWGVLLAITKVAPKDTPCFAIEFKHRRRWGSLSCNEMTNPNEMR